MSSNDPNHQFVDQNNTKFKEFLYNMMETAANDFLQMKKENGEISLTKEEQDIVIRDVVNKTMKTKFVKQINNPVNE